MEYRYELKVHPDGNLEEDKAKQVKQPSTLYRVDHKMARKTREEYADGLGKLLCSDKESQVMTRPSHPQDYGDMDITEPRQSGLPCSLMEILHPEREEPPDPSWWARLSQVEARGAQGPAVNQVADPLDDGTTEDVLGKKDSWKQWFLGWRKYILFILTMLSWMLSSSGGGVLVDPITTCAVLCVILQGLPSRIEVSLPSVGPVSVAKVFRGKPQVKYKLWVLSRNGTRIQWHLLDRKTSRSQWSGTRIQWHLLARRTSRSLWRPGLWCLYSWWRWTLLWWRRSSHVKKEPDKRKLG